MAPGRWANVMSLDLGWMAPGQARGYVDAAREAGILVDGGDGLRLAFDPKEVDVPRHFRPEAVQVATPDLRATAPPGAPEGDGPDEAPSLFLSWVDRLAAAREVDRDAALEAVRGFQDEMGGLLTAEAAVLALAADAGLDVSEAADEALRALR